MTDVDGDGVTSTARPTIEAETDTRRKGEDPRDSSPGLSRGLGDALPRLEQLSLLDIPLAEMRQHVLVAGEVDQVLRVQCA